MKAILDVYDKPLTGDPTLRRQLSFSSEWTTGVELIRRRIEDELAETWHLKDGRQTLETLAARLGWLVEPAELPSGPPGPPPVDMVDRQLAVAIKAFVANGFIMIVDDRQVTDLEAPINLRQDSAATFIRLMPLVGG